MNQAMSERAIAAALVKAVRCLAIKRHSRLGENARLIPNGGSCDLCNGKWEEAQAEDHAPDCLARPNLAAALAAAQRVRPFYECPECGADLAIATHAYGCNRPAVQRGIKSLNEEAEGEHCNLDYRPDPAQRVAGEDRIEAARRVVAEWMIELWTARPKWLATMPDQEALDVLASKIAALALSPGKVEGWREIESAPKDTAVLTYGFSYDVAHFNTSLGRWVTCWDHRHIQPRNWQPLPSPPISSRAEDSPNGE